MIKSLKIEDVTSSICYAELKEWMDDFAIHYNGKPLDEPLLNTIVHEAVITYNLYKVKLNSAYSGFSYISKSTYERVTTLYTGYKKMLYLGLLLYIDELGSNSKGITFLGFRNLIINEIRRYNPLVLTDLNKIVSRLSKIIEDDVYNKTFAKPVQPINKLPEFFNGKLRNSEAATKQFMELLRKCCKSIGKRNGKTWGHVREALINIGLIDTYSAKMTLAQTIADICPSTTKSSVNQSMKRYYGKRDSVTDANIIADIAKQFQPVLDAIKP